MLDKEMNQVFSEKLRSRFVELGFPKSTASKVAKLMLPIKINENKIISNCSNHFYLDQIIIPQKDEIEILVKNCWGNHFSFEIEKNSSNKKSNLRNRNKNNITEYTNTLFPDAENFERKEKTTLIEKNTLDIKQQVDHFRTLEPELNFNTFVRCESNLAAYTACEAVSNSPGILSNPLFIYGSTGVGKTHLLHSAGNEIYKKNGDFKILYITSNDFVNDVIHRGIKAGKMEEVRRKYNSCDVLLVDDIQFLENKDACQMEFFHTFNELYQKKKQIIITCDKFPKDIPNIEERLKSRFLQGLLVDIEPPGFEDRVAIIESKSSQIKLNMNQELCFLIATHAKTNVRELEGVLKDLSVIQKISGNEHTLESVSNVLKKRFPTYNNQTDLDMTTIQKTVSSHFQIKISDIMGQNRQKKFVVARHVAMYLAKEILNLQIVEISEVFGKKDHTTALHAISKVRELIETDSEFKHHIIVLKKKLNL